MNNNNAKAQKKRLISKISFSWTRPMIIIKWFQVKLYDLRSFDKGPFVTFNLPQERQCEWTGLKFSPNGQSILLTTNGSVMRLIEAFQGQPLQTFAGHLNNKGIAVEGCFSPDSKFVFSGSTDGRIHIWDADSGKCLILLFLSFLRLSPKLRLMQYSISIILHCYFVIVLTC